MKIKRIFALLLAVVLCMAAFPMTAFANADVVTTEQTAATETTTPTPEPTPSPEPQSLTPEGNLSLVDDIRNEAAEDKQFITVVTKTGNYFYIIIDRAAEGENTVHFLNQVDEADLLALMEDGGETEAETPAVCICTVKCKAGSVNTACTVCALDMKQCLGTAPEPDTNPDAETEPEPEKKSGSGGAIVIILLLALAGGGAAYYFKIYKPKQFKGNADLDDYDFGDDEDESEESDDDIELEDDADNADFEQD